MVKKSLYKATCLTELNKLASKPVHFNSPQLVQEAMDECFQRAVECRQYDEEVAYILLMRYFDCYNRLKYLSGNTTTTFTTALKKQTLLAMDYLEALHQSLEKRYEAANSSQTQPLQLPTPPKSPVSKPRELTEDVVVSPEANSTGWISVTELATRIRTKKQTLLIDLRPSNQYEKCHIKWNQLINFPADENLSKATTFTKISSALSTGPFHTHWKNRGLFEQIVILDNESGPSATDIPVSETLSRSHPLILMKDAIFKRDASGVVKTEPLVLAGGMREFLLRYAPLTSSPDHRIDLANRGASFNGSELPLNHIDYPDMVAKDKEFAEAQLRRKRIEEEEEARNRKAAEAAAMAAKAASAGAKPASQSDSQKELSNVHSLDRPDNRDEQGTKHALGDLNSVPAQPISRLSDGSSTELNLDERLRLLRVCKPKPPVTTPVKPAEVVDSSVLQPPKVDRTRKPSALPIDIVPQSTPSDHTLAPEEPSVFNGLINSTSSQELQRPSLTPYATVPERPDSGGGMSRSGSAHSQLGSATGLNSTSSNQNHPVQNRMTSNELRRTSVTNRTDQQQSTSLLPASTGLPPPASPPPTLPSCHEQPLGLRNLGNTCYMNAVIQSLAHTRALASFFLRCLDKKLTNLSNPLGYGGAVSTQFQRLFTAVWSALDCTTELTQFKSVVAKHCATFAGFDQQDSLEFLLFLLDGLHEDMNEARKGPSVVNQSGEQTDEEDDRFDPQKRAALAWERYRGANDSVIVSTFQGQLLSTIQCRRCDKRSSKFDAFMCLSLPLPACSTCNLQMCMSLFGSPEEMDDQWFCPRCKCRTNATKRLTVWRLPTYLIIHLKRFRFQENSWKKSTNCVNFPVDDYSPQLDKGTYCLYAVINHFGTMESGHYTAFCRSITDGRWYEYNDSVVSEISPYSIQSSAAYILFYERLPRIEVFSKPATR